MKLNIYLKENPYLLLLITSIFLVNVVAFLPIAIQDRQEIVVLGISFNNFLWIIPISLTCLCILYLGINNYLYSKTLSCTHVLITTITAFLLFILLYIGIHPSHFTTKNHEFIGISIQILFFTFVLGQLILLANIALGIKRKFKTH